MDVAGPSKLCWAARHDSIRHGVKHPAVQAVLGEMTSATHISRAIRSLKGKGKAFHAADVETDLGLEALWSSSRLEHADRNRTRIQALPTLRQLSVAVLKPSDFPTVAPLQRSAAGYVEIVRSRFNRQLYVLKTVVKGLARRESHRCNPSFEARILAEAQHVEDCRKPVPDFLASFQSQNSLHIALQYFPAGDLDQLLHSAGQAGALNGFGCSGRLLDESYVKVYATDIVAAVAWCHERGFAHRDVKPANFLLDRSGHLKLCDFATAAPFATFAITSPLLSPRRRILHKYSCLAGTPDYIAPDVLLGEEERINSLVKRGGTSFGASLLEESSFSMALSASRISPDSEGFYGPEIDWWSVGIVIYEMIYKNVPFWAETIREAHHRICNHERYLHFDENVPVSTILRQLVKSLLTKRDNRLGSGLTGSDDVKNHAFFVGVNWNRYLEAEAPFIPNVDTMHAAGGPTQELIEEEPSVIHSPQVLPGRQQAVLPDQSCSMTPGSIHLSQMFSGNPNEFPLFVDSFDDGERGSRSSLNIGERAESFDQEDLAIVSPRQSYESVSNWSEIETAWIGFSNLPARNAFVPIRQVSGAGSKNYAAPVDQMVTPAQPTRLSSFASILEISPASSPVVASPEEWSVHAVIGGPTTSTPYAKSDSIGFLSSSRTAGSPPPILASTPAARLPLSLQRHAIAIASRHGTPADGRFLTPLRKASMPDTSSACSQSRQLGSSRAAVTSPYPFPIAATPAPARASHHLRLPSNSGRLMPLSVIRSLPLKTMSSRKSESPYSRIVSMGSDSRCSGGSNTKRDFSENEAMEQLEAAVLQSARKVRIESQERSFPPRLAALEEKVATSMQAAKPRLQQSRTAPTLPTVNTCFVDHQAAKDLTEQPPLAPTISINGASPDRAELSKTVINRSGSLRPAAAKSTLTESSESLSQGGSFSERRRNRLIIPTPLAICPVSLKPPAEESEPETDLPLASRPADRQSLLDRQNSVSSVHLHQSSVSAVVTKSTAQHLKPPPRAGLVLRSRRSDRQLKLEAQERTTPTRPTRANSPLLTTEFDLAHLSLGPPTPLEERANPTQTFALLAPNLSDECRTPDLTDNNDSESSNSGDSLGTNASVLGSVGKTADLQQLYSNFAEAAHGAGPFFGKPAVTRLSVPATSFAAKDFSRLRSRSHSQLPKLHHLSLGVTAHEPVQVPKTDQTLSSYGAKGQFQTTPTGLAEPSEIQRKDSREMLKEYRNSSRLVPSPRFPSFSEDAFGGVALPAPLAAAHQANSVPKAWHCARRATRRSSTSLTKQFVGSIGRPNVTASARGTDTRRNSGAEQRNRLPHCEMSKTFNEVAENPSPLTKMDHRLTGLQTSVFGIQSRISKLKAKLHD